ncbi:MAG: DUF1737 domain-containing protein [Actinobacteria bacterium]|nr:DUF1737 domain-containing protein [Actinomycetota bacterium]
MTTADDRLRYRLLTGPDERSFCERISAALDEGYATPSQEVSTVPCGTSDDHEDQLTAAAASSSHELTRSWLSAIQPAAMDSTSASEPSPLPCST